MAAEDLAPNRLEQAKHSIDSLLDRLEGDRVALVTFAGQAVLNCPLTVDHGAVRLFLESTDPTAVPVAGTALAEALGLALRALRPDLAGTSTDRGRSVVVYSDGEDHEGDLDEMLSAYENSGVSVHTVGCGTTRGAPIPLRDAAGMITGYKKDRDDKVVTTRLNEPILERIALETNGRYFRATAGEMEVEQIGAALAGLEAGEIGSALRTRYEDRFQIPLLIAWVALLCETLLGDRRSPRQTRKEQEAAS
jgi:Ca-activated chloride channel family protein